MASPVRFAKVVVLSAAVVAAARPAPAAPPQAQVTAAVDRGVAYLKDGLAAGGGWGGSHGIGPPALTGIALIEAQLPATDPTIQAIAAAVRKAALTEGKTYQASLCLLFLDKLEDPADVPLIQVLACRLLAGQKPSGVWEYTCPADPLDAPFVAALTEKKLGPGLKDDKGNPQLHPLVAEYYGKLPKAAASQAGDHSNTQFGLLAVWASRKHGVPVEDALDRVAARFRDAQRRDGGWAYTTAPADNTSGSMTCAGLLGLSTYVARQEEKWAAARAGRREKEKEKQARDPSDPFVTREDGGGKKDRRPPDAVDGAVQAGFQGLGALFTGGGVRLLGDLYFLWSLERVGVIYGADKIGGVDWYDVGARFLLETQQRDGSWQATAGHRASPDVDTSFAVLFLLKANIARDLSSRVSGKGTTELRAGGGDPTPSGRARPVAPNKGGPPAGGPALPAVGAPAADEATRMAANLATAGDADFPTFLAQYRDAKGTNYTKALLVAIENLDGDRRKLAREALVDRLFRMDAKTLRAMMVYDNPELRRGAVLAAATQDDKQFVPDLIARIAEDDEELVVRAAKAGLVSLTGSPTDLGPAEGAGKDERKAAAEAWRAYWAKNKP